ncbi:hypothetical protein [Sulfuricurvum sp.]|uniref:hypothetical protein n=1 Tax=Sulfuricurvum sp. TaxID=2025608 RepID=UPI003BAF7289
MKYAVLNLEGVITEVCENTNIPNGAIEITDIEYENILNGGVWEIVLGAVTHIPNVLKTIAELKTKKLSTIKTDYENAVKVMTGNTDPAEMASWTKQEQEARAWIADNAVITPIIDNLIIGRAMGESKADLVVKIITKADAYTVAYAQVLGAYHAKQKAIEVAKTVMEVEAI